MDGLAMLAELAARSPVLMVKVWQYPLNPVPFEYTLEFVSVFIFSPPTNSPSGTVAMRVL